MANTYRFIYEANKGEGRKIYGALEAAKSDADQIIVDIEDIKDQEFKVIYEKEGIIYGSVSGTPAEGDVEIIEVKALYEEAAQPVAEVNEEEQPVEEVVEEEQPEVAEEEVEEPIEEETEEIE